jgi:phenylpyruvate tautomerase PptA (4-oxalocrotonate tautomerase family)
MPLMDLIYPEGALTEEARTELLETLWQTCLRWEGVPETPATASIAWVYLDERPPASISVGGAPPTQAVYRVHVRVMSGFMEQDRVDGMVREVTDAILKADGTDGDGSGRPRVYCIVDEVPSGTWGVDGAVWHSVPTAVLIGADPARVAAMRAAIAARPRIEVPLGQPS